MSTTEPASFVLFPWATKRGAEPCPHSVSFHGSGWRFVSALRVPFPLCGGGGFLVRAGTKGRASELWQSSFGSFAGRRSGERNRVRTQCLPPHVYSALLSTFFTLLRPSFSPPLPSSFLPVLTLPPPSSQSPYQNQNAAQARSAPPTPGVGRGPSHSPTYFRRRRIRAEVIITARICLPLHLAPHRTQPPVPLSYLLCHVLLLSSSGLVLDRGVPYRRQSQVKLINAQQTPSAQ
ncbi:hypothetical protein B0H14DRAFT_3460864 [Mycena olivaceomarginata]|nr:hypothetical protein B0H14DRAFT_3460864 [Mycena olivaceomarginata]